MAEFLDEQLDPCTIIAQTNWTESYDVEVVEAAGGSESRRLIQPYPRATLPIGYMDINTNIAAAVLSLYRRAYGAFAAFRVKFPDDYTTADDGIATPAGTDQAALSLTATTWQLQKLYPGAEVLGIGAPVRTIFKPVSGTVVVQGDGSPAVETTDYTIDYATGILTWVSSPVPAAVTFGCQFDYPMRFNAPIEVTPESDTVRAVSCELVEVLNP